MANSIINFWRNICVIARSFSAMLLLMIFCIFISMFSSVMDHYYKGHIWTSIFLSVTFGLQIFLILYYTPIYQINHILSGKYLFPNSDETNESTETSQKEYNKLVKLSSELLKILETDDGDDE